ncbi:alpha/beta fold hydrolase [Albidovulum sediminis]|uniref:Alpha/beta hydrolase n=1 Tax=Albidovulum sediminis TaxID=3066345 RepID=A0ABT2NKU6_9RHOB|nr:alpha/beta hydrolase [Defluviimonas sediminis]MCT8328574.1 alpha/beta hydrolase [Defluviimonas sediminis]
MPATFILVHGAFGSPAELAPTVPFLEARGHRVVNVDLPCERAEAMLEDYAAAVTAAMRGCDRPCVLVAHSAGGTTVPLVAARVPVDRMVFVAAIVPEPGQSIVGAIGPEVAGMITSITVDNGNGTRAFDIDLLTSLALPEEREAYRAFLQATQRNQGWAAVNQPWPGAEVAQIPRHYVLCTEDQVIPPALQQVFAARLGVDPVEIASVHAAFTFKPQELAEILASFVE